MDLLNLPNRTQIYEFYKNLKILEIFTFLGTVLKFGDLLLILDIGNICKISAQYLQNAS